MFLTLVLTCVPVSLMSTGCNTTANQAAFQAVSTTHVTVQEAMGGWDQWIKAGKTTVSQEQAVKTAFKRWQSAMLLVCDAGAVEAASVNTNSTSGATGVSGAFQQLVGSASQYQIDLINLIQSFGVTF